MEHILNNIQENIDSVKQNQVNTRRKQAKIRKDYKVLETALPSFRKL